MATLRRSLIHVDFLIRKKKKKDKRRNTVADIDSSSLSGPPEQIDNSKQRRSVPCTSSELNETNDSSNIQNSKSDSTIAETKVLPKILCTSPEENNNTKSFIDTKDKCLKNNEVNNIKASSEEVGLNTNYRNISTKAFVKSKCRQEENHANSSLSKQPAEWAKRIKESAEIKKKTRTNIPISTVSAAMTVAVKMRQTSGFTNSEDAQSSSGNWSGSNSSGRASSDSDDIKASVKASSSKDSLLSESTSSYSYQRNQKDLDETCKDETVHCSPVPPMKENMQSPFTNGNSYSNKFSFDSDDDDQSVSSYFECNRYTSSTSISTGSNESLNSLLSRTATELSLSTETLTSEAKFPLPPPPTPPPPPPPPPPRISSARPNSPTVKINKTTTYSSTIKTRKKENLPPSIKVESQVKQKTKSSDIKKPNEDPKAPRVTFSALLQKKFKLKENRVEKPKHNSPRKLQKIANSRCIDMYGGQSNQKVTILINGNKLPSPEKPKMQLQSFLPKNAGYDSMHLPNGYSNTNRMYAMENSSIYNSSRASSRTECTSPTNSEVFSDSAVESSDETSLPLKYAPHITVRPLRRLSDTYQSPAVTSSFENSADNTYHRYLVQNQVNNYKHHGNRDFEFYSHNTQSHPQNSEVPYNYNGQRNANAAHVILDTNGQVIHSTSSLDRRLYNKPSQHIYSEPPSYSSSPQYMPYNHKQSGIQNRNVSFSPCDQREISQPQNYSRTHATDILKSQSDYHIPYQQADSQRLQNFSVNHNSFTPQHKNREIQENSFYYGSLPSHGKGNRTACYTEDVYQLYNESINSAYNATELCAYPSSDNEHPTLPIGQSLLTQENVSQHAKKTQAPASLRILNRSPLSDGYYDHRTPSQVNGCSDQNFNNSKSTQPITMTAEDLFAIIHNSKKRLNIKTESDISPTPSSSRSNSPSFFRQVSTPSKNGLAETGFLSPRSSLSSRDRRSWADFRPTTERKSLASDRMGPSKPTSLHEFKMLLLQTRSSTRGSNQRKSAVEQLKATSPNKCTESMETSADNLIVPSNLSPLQSSVTYSMYDGHLTVPLKRGHRARGTIPPRYIMYPPILEDCLEETENCSETLHSNTSKCLISKNANEAKNRQVDSSTVSKIGSGSRSETKTVHFENSSMWV